MYASDAARVPSLRFLSGYVVTMRPYLLFVSGVTGIAGLALGPRLPAANTLLLAAAFFLSYGFGQALTDCFQLDTDSLSAPYRPLVRGEIRRGDVLVVSLAGLSAIAVVLALHNPLNIPLAALAVIGLATYTPFKRRWWAGPFYNAWIVAVLAAIGYVSTLGAAGTAPEASVVVTATILCAFFAYANFVLAGYYKDISADRATGYRTLPVAFGTKTSAAVSDAFAAASLIACGAALYATLAGQQAHTGHVIVALLLSGGVAATLLAQLRLHGVREESDAHRAITPVVHAYILQLAAIAAAQKPDWAVWLILFYIGFVVFMTRRPMREQI